MRVKSVCISGDHLVTGSSEGTAILWSVNTKEQIRTFRGHTDDVSFVCISGDHLVTGGGKTAILWNMNSGEQKVFGFDEERLFNRCDVEKVLVASD